MQVDKGSRVKLSIGKGPDKVNVPNVVGKDFDSAKAELENADFEVKREEASSDKPENEVIDQNPKGEAVPGDTITLTVSNGDQIEDQFTMPDLTGKTKQEAEAELRGLGWTGQLDSEDGGETNDVGKLNTIIDQQPDPNQKIDKDEDIRILIATEFNPNGR